MSTDRERVCGTCVHCEHRGHHYHCGRRKCYVSNYDRACPDYERRGEYPIGKTRQERSLMGLRREVEE